MPRRAAASVASFSRRSPTSSGGTPCPPFSPEVRNRTRTVSPATTWPRRVPPHPSDSSSGWGLTTSTRRLAFSSSREFIEPRLRFLPQLGWCFLGDGRRLPGDKKVPSDRGTPGCRLPQRQTDERVRPLPYE